MALTDLSLFDHGEESVIRGNRIRWIDDRKGIEKGMKRRRRRSRRQDVWGMPLASIDGDWRERRERIADSYQRTSMNSLTFSLFLCSTQFISSFFLPSSRIALKEALVGVSPPSRPSFTSFQASTFLSSPCGSSTSQL